jgi:hypothetical protein
LRKRVVGTKMLRASRVDIERHVLVDCRGGGRQGWQPDARLALYLEGLAVRLSGGRVVPLRVELGVDLVSRPIRFVAGLARAEAADMLELGEIRNVRREAGILAEHRAELGHAVDVILALDALGDGGGVLLDVGGPDPHLAIWCEGLHLLEGARTVGVLCRLRGRSSLLGLALLALLGGRHLI